MEGCRLDYTN